MEEFCNENGIEHELCGKVIVALSEEEIPRMEKIYRRGQENGVNCEIIDRKRLLEIEPHAAGIRAIHVPECGIVNYRQVCERMGELISQRDDNELLLGQEVRQIEETSQGLLIKTDQLKSNPFFDQLGGPSFGSVARLSGQPVPAKIIPFKGEYYELTQKAKHLCKHLIYRYPIRSFLSLACISQNDRRFDRMRTECRSCIRERSLWQARPEPQGPPRVPRLFRF